MAAARDRVLAEYNAILDSFANLIRSARVPEENVDQEKAKGPRVPGELMEVFVEKLLQSCAALLGLVAELKRNALLNDFAARNKEVGVARAEAAAAAAEAEARYAALQQEIHQALAELEGRALLPAAQQGQQQQQPQQPAGGQAAAGQQPADMMQLEQI